MTLPAAEDAAGSDFTEGQEMGGIREFNAEIDGGAALCITFGRGDRPLVMVPGLRFSSIRGGGPVLAAAYRIFAKEYRVYVIDRKDPVSPGCTIRDLAKDLAAVMEKLGVTCADVIGVSQGGMIAQELAIGHPELVRKLVLGVTAARPNDTMTDAIRTWTEMVSRGDYGAAARDYMVRGFSQSYIKKYRLFLPLAVKLQKTMAPEQFIALAEACLTCDSFERLDTISCPVLVLGGGKDRVVTGEASLEIAQRLGCDYYVYPELSHEAYNEAPDFNRRIYDFLRG